MEKQGTLQGHMWRFWRTVFEGTSKAGLHCLRLCQALDRILLVCWVFDWNDRSWKIRSGKLELLLELEGRVETHVIALS